MLIFTGKTCQSGDRVLHNNLSPQTSVYWSVFVVGSQIKCDDSVKAPHTFCSASCVNYAKKNQFVFMLILNFFLILLLTLYAKR